MLIQADDVEAQLDRSTCFFYRATQHDKAPNHQIKKTTRFFFPDEPTARILYQVTLFEVPVLLLIACTLCSKQYNFGCLFSWNGLKNKLLPANRPCIGQVRASIPLYTSDEL